MTEEDLKAVWKSGHELDFAWIQFAKFFDHFSWIALRTFPENDDVNLKHHPRYEQIRDWLPRTWEARQLKLKITTESERFNLLSEIFRGTLWAIGFRTLPSGFDEVTRVPRQLFRVEEDATTNSPQIDWAKSEIKFGDLTYFDIRVVSPHIGGVSAGAKPNNRTPQTRSSGRPKTSGHIRAKVLQLWKVKAFRAMSPRIQQAREVRAQLCGEEHRNDDGMSGYKSSVIQRIIGEVASSQADRSEKTE